MGLLNLGNLKKSKVSVSKTNPEKSYASKVLAKARESFGLKHGKGINLPKGNPPINK